MRPALALALALALAMSACATLKGHDAPGCSGPRRPANPTGSVLAPEMAPAPAAPAAAAGVCAGAPR